MAELSVWTDGALFEDEHVYLEGSVNSEKLRRFLNHPTSWKAYFLMDGLRSDWKESIPKCLSRADQI
jgi:hypothetical protein